MLSSSARLVRRVMITLLGVGVLALGTVMLIFPGPGVLVIGLGFFILSLEYEWAHRRFEMARSKAADLADMAVAKPLSTAGSILAALLLVAAGVIWGVVDTLPFSSWIVGASLIAGGLAALATIGYSLHQARGARAAGVPTRGERLLGDADDGTGNGTGNGTGEERATAAERESAEREGLGPARPADVTRPGVPR